LGGKTADEKVESLIKAIDELKAKVNMPMTIKEAGISEEKFYATLDEMSEKAFDDQCTGGNPRYPLIHEIKQIYINTFDKAEAVKEPETNK
jgi:acetaldehyde dehydrogenase/alcohol dehydrogenase